jgi:hypothetical protein
MADLDVVVITESGQHTYQGDDRHVHLLHICC